MALAGCGGHLDDDPSQVGPEAQAARRPPAPAGSPNVVVCVIDAARADHVGCYGYPRETTPNIDQLSGESVVFRNHFVPYSQTKPSTASLLTGLYPDTHLTHGYRAMDESLFTMEKGLAAAGYRTVLFSSNPLASPEMGVGGDFDEVFASPERLDYPQGRAERGKENAWKVPEILSTAFSRWLDADQTGVFFAYLHFLPPHLPYDAPEAMQRMFAGQEPAGAWQGDYPFPEVAARRRGQRVPPLDEWVNLYDANLRWADDAVGVVVGLLREHGLLDETLLIVTSDHGEAFGEHGYTYHTRGVYDELVHVPLLIRLPGGGHSGDVAALTQTVDILPTVFDVLGREYPKEEVQGRSLLPLIRGERDWVRELAFATCVGPDASYLVRSRTHALILYEGGVLRALYDLRADPMQQRNVIEEQPEQAARMTEEFREFAVTQRQVPLDFVDPEARRASEPAPATIELTEEQRRELEALGYVD